MEIIDSEIQSYIDKFSKHLIPELADLEKETYEKVLLPQMLSGKEQGTFLYQFVKALNPVNVLELGTYTGYSAICMALGMKKEAELTTLDINEEIAYIPKKYFESIDLKPTINQLIEEALPYCEKLDNNSLDMVFIDADKKNYPNYFSTLKSKLRIGGYILVDNVLWSGKVTKPNQDKDTEAIKSMTEMIYNDKSFVTNIIPIRDGILVAFKV